MIKNNKWKLIISSIVILLPVTVFLIGDKILPEEISAYWGFGSMKGASSIFWILPLVLLAFHWMCTLLATVLDKNAAQNKKIVGLVFWIIPVISLSTSGTILMTALGQTSSIYAVISIVIAVSFIVIGNYLPKTTRNVTMGIKIKWTLSSDENWNATHRFAGKVYVVIGFLYLLAMALPSVVFPYVATASILLCCLLPVIYSYRFYQKQLAAELVTREACKKAYGELFKYKKSAVIITVAVLVPLLIFLPFVMFTGSVETTLEESSLTVKASFWNDFTVNYDEIDAVEYREGGVDGQRINGIGSARLLIGFFRNEEFGAYTRYTYTGDRPCVVLTIDGDTVVIGAEKDESVMAIYERILAEISK